MVVGAGLAVATGLVAPVAGAARGVRRSLGSAPPPYDSPQFHDGVFRNRLPARLLDSSDTSFLRDWISRGSTGRPAGPVPLARPGLPVDADDLAATWLGHATVLLEVGGHWVLTDPVWSDRVSPSATVGPRRQHPVPLALGDLPTLSAVLISHDHYDHLDTATVDWLAREQSMPFVVPLGIGAHLHRWGVPDRRIVELDWDESHTIRSQDTRRQGTRGQGIGDLELICTEAQHFSGRSLTRNRTLWSSWVVRAGEADRRRSVFFGGDTGYTPAFAGIGERFGPFGLTLLPIGAYDRRWPDVHLDPAEAVRTHLDVGGDVLLPIHWATYDLAFHGWADPASWLAREAVERSVRVAIPRPGERVDATAELPAEDWWSALGSR